MGWFDQNPYPTDAFGTQAGSQGPALSPALQTAAEQGTYTPPTNTLSGESAMPMPGSLGTLAGNPATQPAASGAAPTVTNPTDPAQVDAWLQWQANQPGADPILKTPEGRAYYSGVIMQTGGLTDPSYWANKSTLAQYGGAVGAGGASGGGMYQGGAFSMPSASEFQQSPGYQFSVDQANQAIQRSAAAKGTLLTGGTLKALAGYTTGLANQDYNNYFNRAFQTNQGNFNNLYNLSTLGEHAVTGAAS